MSQQNEPGDIQKYEDIQKHADSLNRLRKELSPEQGSDKPLVLQWTLNGYTYPFVLRYGIAALPHPAPSQVEEKCNPRADQSRRHDLLSGAILAREGDILVFFQADPQRNSSDSLRGLVGVYRVTGNLYSSTQALCLSEADLRHFGLRLPNGVKEYRLHGVCPECGTPYSNLSKCKNGHTTELPGSDGVHEYILNLRLNIRPEIVFRFPVPDEAAYADLRSLGDCMADIFFWTGRHDNAMGAGKGSSVRVLLPEEFLRLLLFFERFPQQKVISLSPGGAASYGSGTPVTNPDGSKLEEMVFLRKNSQAIIGQEDMLMTAFSLKVREPSSDLRRNLNQILGREGVNPQDLFFEYASPEYPIGYTATSIDYVVVFRSKKSPSERHVFVFELKREANQTGSAVLQLWFYIPWVLQVFSGSLGCHGKPKIHVYPVVVGPSFPNRGLRVPKKAQGQVHLLCRGEHDYIIHGYSFWEYRPANNSTGASWFRSQVDLVDKTNTLGGSLMEEELPLPNGLPLRHIASLGSSQRKLLEVLRGLSGSRQAMQAPLLPPE